MVTISLFLFGKPAWEIHQLEGSEVDRAILEEVAACGKELDRRLSRASEVGTKLLGAGWQGVGLLYDIDFHKAVTLEEAEGQLKALGIEPGEVSVIEDDDDSEGGSNGD